MDDRSNDSDDIGAEPVPRWVKISGAICVAIVVLFLLMLLFGGGRHGPSRHMNSSHSDASR